MRGVEAFLRDPDFFSGVPVDPSVNLELTKPTDPDSKCVRAQIEHHQQLFDLSTPDGLAEYTELRSKAMSKADGITELLCDRHFVQEGGTYKVKVDYEWTVTRIVPFLDKPAVQANEQNAAETRGQVVIR